ncbi:hypothetical protein EDC04DRAFT_2833338 [Pisolithus marmoratus]|nr:hypothetical protein EDC04DRAFT_2833338 [Pisolithus marmoratus]
MRVSSHSAVPLQGTAILLSDPEHVITREEARKYYSTKVEYIRTNLETLSETIQKKQENVNYLINVMQAKIGEQAQSPTQASKSNA